jgi:hypothetical protein
LKQVNSSKSCGARSAGKPARGNTLVDGQSGRKQAGIEGQDHAATGNARLEAQRE